MGPIPTRTCSGGWFPTCRPRVVDNAPAFVDELRWTLEVVAVHLLPTVGRPQPAVVPRPTPAGGTVLLDESPINGA